MLYEYRLASTMLDENAGVKTWVVRWVTSLPARRELRLTRRVSRAPRNRGMPAKESGLTQCSAKGFAGEHGLTG